MLKTSSEFLIKAFHYKHDITLLLFVCFIYFGINYLWPMFPIPWPDEIAFFVSGKNLIEKGTLNYSIWSYLNKSYENALFNQMPLYGISLFLWKTIINSENYLTLGAFNVFFGSISILSIYFLIKSLNKNFSPLEKLFIYSPIITSLFLYHNLHIIRPEALIVPSCFVLFYFLSKYKSSGHLKSRLLNIIGISLILGLCANLHYNAIILVPFVFIFVFDFKDIKRSISDLSLISLFTLVVLTPWLIYLITHFNDFKIQFLDQTSRMYGGIDYKNYFQYILKSFFNYKNLSILENKYILYGIRSLKILTSGVVITFLAVSIKKKLISKVTIKVSLCLIISCFFFAIHQESWYIIFPEMLMTLLLILLIIDLISIKIKIQLPLILLFSINLILIIFIIFYFPLRCFSKDDYKGMISCLSMKLKDHETVVVNGTPDPSLALLLKKPGLNIKRMVDYPFYSKEWNVLVNREHVFITANFKDPNFDGINNIPLDHDNSLKYRLLKAKKDNKLDTKVFKLGRKINIYFHRIGCREIKTFNKLDASQWKK